MAILLKVLKWIPLNVVSVLGVGQAIIKLLKEIITSVVNFLAAVVVLIPGVDFNKANVVVMSIRTWIEKADGWVEVAKVYILKWVKS